MYIRKRGDSWSYTIDAGRDPVTSKRKQKTKGGFKSEKAAERAAIKVLAELESGQYVHSNKVGFKEFAEEWLEEYKLSGVKENTYNTRKYHVAISVHYLGGLKLQDITRRHYREMFRKINTGYSHNYLRKINITTTMIFRYAQELGIIKDSPSAFFKLPKKSEEHEDNMIVEKYLEKEELVLFLDTVKEKGREEEYELFLLLAFTGARIGEALGLKWLDLDFKRRTISISRTVFDSGLGKDQVHSTKTSNSTRLLEVDQRVFDALRKMKAQRTVTKLGDSGNFLFQRIRTRSVVNSAIKKVLALCEIQKDLSSHSFRHTHASLMAEAGASLEEIQNRLGHKSDEITRNIYLHITNAQKKSTAEKFSDLMNHLF